MLPAMLTRRFEILPPLRAYFRAADAAIDAADAARCV